MREGRIKRRQDMSFGLLYGKSQLTPAAQLSGDGLADWIERQIPSFVGSVPAKYVDALFAVFNRYNVKVWIIEEAFSKLEKKGVRFEGIAARLPTNRYGNPARPAMHQAEKMSAEDQWKIARMLEQKYVFAVKTNDYEAQASILRNFLNLFRNLLMAAMIGRKPKEHEDRQKAGQQLRLMAPSTHSDAEKLASQGVQNPTSRDVQNRLVPSRPSSQRRGPRR